MEKKTKIILLILCLLGLAYVAFGQCEDFTPIDGGMSGVSTFDSAAIDTGAPRCVCLPSSPSNGVTGWNLPDNFQGHLYLYSPTPSMVSIQIVSNCNDLLWDTCATLLPWMAGNGLILHVDLPVNASVIVSGTIGQMIVLEVKAGALGGDYLHTPIADLAPCNALGIDPRHEAKPRYIDLRTLIEGDLQPFGVYKTIE